jgi:hypothetical protein
MISSLDPFALSFDSIKLEPKPAHASPEGERRSLFVQGALPEEPGFYLIDDADGRFSIDRDTGVVSLSHAHVLELERGAVHGVHIKVLEPSGASYELKFRLRITGRVPQLLGAQENDALAALTSAALLDLMQASEAAPAPAPAPASRVQPWVGYSAAYMHGAPRRLGSDPGSERARFGALLEPRPLGRFDGATELALSQAPPAPARATADWLI